MKNIVILGSGADSNAENIALYFKNHPTIRVTAFVCNRADAGIVKRAAKLGLPYRVFDRATFYDGYSVVDY